MLARPLAGALAGCGIHYGWVVVAVTFTVMLATAGAAGMPGVLILPLGREFGWATASISGPLALRLALYGLMAPFAAELMARYGLRATVLGALALVVAGLGGAILFVSRLWQLWLAWGLVVGVGTGATALVLGAIVASRWFTARRGLVLGLLTASSATGQLVFLPLAAWLAEAHGWRVALVPALAGCAVAALLVLLFVRDHPGELGLAAYGDWVGATGCSPKAPPSAPTLSALEVLTSVSRSRVFWILFGTFFVCGLSTNGLIQTHFVPLCVDFGVPAVKAASVLAVIGAFDFIGTVVSGWLSDRYDNRKLLFWYYGLRGLSLVYLPGSGFTLYGLSLFAVFYGLDWVATVPPTARLASSGFGRDRGPIVFGWAFTGHQLGAATAAFGAGVSRDALASYLPAFYLAGLACVAAAIAVLLLPRARAAVAAEPGPSLAASS